jgi:hypothetical protein
MLSAGTDPSSVQTEVNDRIIPQMTIVITNGHENPIAIIAMIAPTPMRHAMPRMVLTSSVVIDGTSFSPIRYAMQPAVSLKDVTADSGQDRVAAWGLASEFVAA